VGVGYAHGLQMANSSNIIVGLVAWRLISIRDGAETSFADDETEPGTTGIPVNVIYINDESLVKEKVGYDGSQNRGFPAYATPYFICSKNTPST
jgi:hypothetical protein